ncbi:Uncharacterised protein [Mycobacterium tuberculosis]|nr:Uncharacterised protein [Mycobacterium tuberculosis]
MQALDVLGNRLDVLVAHFIGDGLHDFGIAIIGAIAFTEVRQLLGNILRMLAA